MRRGLFLCAILCLCGFGQIAAAQTSSSFISRSPTEKVLITAFGVFLLTLNPRDVAMTPIVRYDDTIGDFAFALPDGGASIVDDIQTDDALNNRRHPDQIHSDDWRVQRIDANAYLRRGEIRIIGQDQPAPTPGLRFGGKDARAPRHTAGASYSYAHTDTNGPTDAQAHSNLLSFGVLLPSDSATRFGYALAFRTGGVTSTPLNTVLNTRALALTALAKTELGPRTELTLSARYGRAENDISINGFTGSFGTTSTALSGSVAKRVAGPGHWIMMPNVTLGYGGVTRETYVNSAGRTITGSTETLGVLRPAVRFEQLLAAPNAILAPWVEISADWAFDAPEARVLNDGTVLEFSTAGVGFAGGLDLVTRDDLRLRVAAGYTARSKAERSWAIRAGIKKTF